MNSKHKNRAFLLLILLMMNIIVIVFPIKLVSATTKTFQISASNQDCERRKVTSWFSLTTSDNTAGYYSSTYYGYGCGLLFVNVDVPKDAVITNAYIQFCARVNAAGSTVNTKISAQDIDNAGVWVDNATIFDQRYANHTSNMVNWDGINAWSVDVWYNSPNIANVIEEVTNRSGWVSGSNIALFWEDYDYRSTYRREARSYDEASTKAPKLVITFTEIWPPTYSQVSSNSTQAGSSCLFSSFWNDETALSGYIFGTNNSGSWVNDTYKNYWATPQEKLIKQHNSTYPRVSAAPIVKLPNGSLLAIYNPKISNTIQGELWARFSHDNGETWVGDYLVKDNGSDYGSIGGALLVSGNKIFLFYSRWKNSFGNCTVWKIVSIDNGVTWGSDTRIDEGNHAYTFTGFNAIKMQNGTLILGIGWWWKLQTYNFFRVGCLRSDDDGETWFEGGQVPDWADSLNNLDEPSVIEFENSTLYMLMRTYGNSDANKRHVYSLSSNYGNSWSNCTKVETLKSFDTHAGLFRLSMEPSKIMVVWIDRISGTATTDRRPLKVAFSTDNCTTWTNIQVLDAGTDKSMNEFFIGRSSDDHLIVSYRRMNKASPYDDDAVSKRFYEGWLTPKSGWSNVTKVLNSQTGKRIEWRIWANDTSNNWNNTGIQFLITTSGNNAPTIKQFSYPSTILPNDGFTINIWVDDAEGVSDIKNSSLNMGKGIILYWQAVSNTFVLQDTYGFAALGLCEKINVNTTSIKLSYRLQISSGYGEGYISPGVTVYDSFGSSASQIKENGIFFDVVAEEETGGGSVEAPPEKSEETPREQETPLSNVTSTWSSSLIGGFAQDFRQTFLPGGEWQKPTPQTVRPFIQRHGAEIIIFTILSLVLYASFRRDKKLPPKGINLDKMSSLEIDFSPITKSKKSRTYTKWLLIIVVVIFLLLFTDVGSYLGGLVK